MNTPSASHVGHPVLQRFYPHVLPLRQYLLAQLADAPTSSRRRIAQLGLGTRSRPDDALIELLDRTLVGCCALGRTVDAAERERAVEAYSQQQPSSSVSSSAASPARQSDVVDFVIWSLFRKHSPGPSHVLCHGFRRASSLDEPRGPAGIVSHHANRYVDAVKSRPWCSVLAALGPNGDRVMMDLLAHCGIFAPVDGTRGNYLQICGRPLADMDALPAPGRSAAPSATTRENSTGGTNKLNAIAFVRSRMLYARPSLSAKGEVRFGLRHIHVLNRVSDHISLSQTTHVMKYVFPRQFGLHNAFTSKVDYRDTSQTFKDYTLREHEIARSKAPRTTQGASGPPREKIPKRLRGRAIDLVRRMRTLHRRCAYAELLRHYCPRPAVGRDETTPFTDRATPTCQVSAFCRAVLSRVVPDEFWGSGATRERNKHVFMKQVDRFVGMGRYESLTVHEVMQGIQVAEVGWLRPPNVAAGASMSRTDSTKRLEIMTEFVYYLFDSFVMPLVSSNFHVTESSGDRNRLHYFRHDVWKELSEPSLERLKGAMFEEVPDQQAERILGSRSLGYSHVRLVPKSSGARPITNLRRRVPVRVNGKQVLGRSINSIMKPVFDALKCEKALQPLSVGSSMFSVGDMFPRLRAFRSALERDGRLGQPLYFVKVDVQSCFDTIPQERLMRLMERVMAHDEYRIGRHVEVKPACPYQYSAEAGVAGRPIKRFLSHGQAAGDVEDALHERMGGGSHTVFVDGVVRHRHGRKKMMELLGEHVERNMVRMGGKFYRQREGIPQGSVLSSLLCSFFYGQLEAEVLSFLAGESLLMRLIDDFLLITTERAQAERFLAAMHAGSDEYGLRVKRDKTLVNFAAEVGGTRVKRVAASAGFPYCGTLVDTARLDVSREVQRRDGRGVRDGMTVEHARAPGRALHRKTLNGLRMQLQAMFLDAGFNSRATVLANAHAGLVEAARRCFEHVRTIAGPRRRCERLLEKTVEDAVRVARAALARAGGRGGDDGRACRWLALHAFDRVFRPRQARHPRFVAFLSRALARARPRAAAERLALQRAAG